MRRGERDTKADTNARTHTHAHLVCCSSSRIETSRQLPRCILKDTLQKRTMKRGRRTHPTQTNTYVFLSTCRCSNKQPGIACSRRLQECTDLQQARRIQSKALVTHLPCHTNTATESWRLRSRTSQRRTGTLVRECSSCWPDTAWCMLSQCILSTHALKRKQEAQHSRERSLMCYPRLYSSSRRNSLRRDPKFCRCRTAVWQSSSQCSNTPPDTHRKLLPGERGRRNILRATTAMNRKHVQTQKHWTHTHAARTDQQDSFLDSPTSHSLRRVRAIAATTARSYTATATKQGVRWPS